MTFDERVISTARFAEQQLEARWRKHGNAMLIAHLLFREGREDLIVGLPQANDPEAKAAFAGFIRSQEPDALIVTHEAWTSTDPNPSVDPARQETLVLLVDGPAPLRSAKFWNVEGPGKLGEPRTSVDVQSRFFGLLRREAKHD